MMNSFGAENVFPDSEQMTYHVRRFKVYLSWEVASHTGTTPATVSLVFSGERQEDIHALEELIEQRE